MKIIREFVQKVKTLLIKFLRNFLKFIYIISNDTTEIDEVLRTVKKTKSASTDIVDLVSIYKMVLKLKPKNILELGPGISTHVICKAIEMIQINDPSYKPNFLAIEESKKWLVYHKKNLKIKYKKIVQFHLEQRIKRIDENGVSFFYYENIPKHPYDFIHLDGPTIEQPTTITYSTDIIRIFKTLNKKCYIIVDGRENTARIILKKIKNLKYTRHLFTLSYHLFT